MGWSPPSVTNDSRIGRFKLWYQRFCQNIKKRWWWIPVWVVLSILWELTEARIVAVTNKFIDDHFAFSALRPIVVDAFRSKWAHPASVMIVGLTLIVLGFVVRAYWETRPQRGYLSDRDPRVVLSYEPDADHVGADGRFIFENRGGVDAHNVQANDLRLRNFSICFPCIPILGTQPAKIAVHANVSVLRGDQQGQQRVVTTSAALEEDWMDFSTDEIKAGKDKVSYEGQINYNDHRGGRFLTEFTLTYALGAQTTQIENFRFRRV